MSLTLVKDLPRNPVNLTGEYQKLDSLYMKNTEWTTSGDASFTSPSSGILYEALTGGELQLYGVLATALEEYILSAEIFNAVVNAVGDKQPLATNNSTATNGQILTSNGDETATFQTLSQGIKKVVETENFVDGVKSIEMSDLYIDDEKLKIGIVYDIENASYDSVSFYVASQSLSPRSIKFNDNGGKLYMLGDTTIFQYTLSTPFDLSTASYGNVSFSVSSQESAPTSIAFNNDGSKLYMVGYANDTIYQYTLSTPFDLSTANYGNVSFSVSNQDTQPFEMTFNNDGNKLYMMGYNTDSIHQYSLSTPFDLSTASYDSISFYVGSQDSHPVSIVFNNNGSKLYMTGDVNDKIHQYTLSAPFDLSTISYDSISFDISGQDGDPASIIFKNDGSKLYMVGNGTDTIYQYTTLLLDTATSGSATIQLSDVSKVHSWDIATTQKTLDGETVTVDLESSDDGVTWTTAISDIDRNTDISSVLASKFVRFAVSISRVSTSNVPTLDYLGLRFNR